MQNILQNKYIFKIQSNGSMFIHVDMLSCGFKIIDIHYINFIVDQDYFFSKFKTLYHNDFLYLRFFYEKLLLNNHLMNHQINYFEKNNIYVQLILILNSNHLVYNNHYIFTNIRLFNIKIITNIFYNFI